MHIVANLHFCLGLGPSQNPLVCKLRIKSHFTMYTGANACFWGDFTTVYNFVMVSQAVIPGGEVRQYFSVKIFERNWM